MDAELQNQLYEKYPDLFSNRNKGRMESCMYWGIECNNGWYELLASVCWRVSQHEKNIEDRKRILADQPEKIKAELEYFPVKFDQVKEKYGGLRIYFSGGDDYVDGIVSMAEEYSYKVCEVCGNAGKPNKGGWITTLCESCREKTCQTQQL
jgi:hypothetical protein